MQSNKVASGVITTLAAAAAFWIIATINSAVSPTIETIRSMAEVHERINERLDSIEKMLSDMEAQIGELRPVPAAVEYQPLVRVDPVAGAPGGRLRITYYLRRHAPCLNGTIEHRFWNVKEDSLESALVSRSPTPGFPKSAEYMPHSEILVVPPQLPPGEYRYEPVVFCEGLPPHVRPPAYFTVVLTNGGTSSDRTLAPVRKEPG